MKFKNSIFREFPEARNPPTETTKKKSAYQQRLKFQNIFLNSILTRNNYEYKKLMTRNPENPRLLPFKN
jgi:hypothetical protein